MPVVVPAVPPVTTIETIAFDPDSTCGLNCDPQTCDFTQIPPLCTAAPDPGFTTSALRAGRPWQLQSSRCNGDDADVGRNSHRCAIHLHLRPALPRSHRDLCDRERRGQRLRSDAVHHRRLPRFVRWRRLRRRKRMHPGPLQSPRWAVQQRPGARRDRVRQLQQHLPERRAATAGPVRSATVNGSVMTIAGSLPARQHDGGQSVQRRGRCAQRPRSTSTRRRTRASAASDTPLGNASSGTFCSSKTCRRAPRATAAHLRCGRRFAADNGFDAMLLADDFIVARRHGDRRRKRRRRALGERGQRHRAWSTTASTCSMAGRATTPSRAVTETTRLPCGRAAASTASEVAPVPTRSRSTPSRAKS